MRAKVAKAGVRNFRAGWIKMCGLSSSR
jgi:hypothetical protein